MALLLESLPAAFNVVAAHSATVPPFGVFCAGCAFASDHSNLAETLEFLASLTGWKDSQSITEAQEMKAHLSLATKGLAVAKAKIERIRLRNQEASQQREAMKTIPQPEAPQYEVICSICTMEIEPKDYLPLERCGHFFHPDCIKEYLEMGITERKFPLVCPILACKEEIVDLDLRERLTPELFMKCEEYRFNLYVQRNQKEVKHCLTPDCPFVFVWEGGDHNFECPICFKKWCLDCKKESHPMLTCEEYKELMNPMDFDRFFGRFEHSEGFKQCPQCEVMVEKSDGCDFIQCQCGFKFCFRCGTGFKDCKCGLGFCEKCLADRVHCTCGREMWGRGPRGPPRFGPPGLDIFDMLEADLPAFQQRPGMPPPGLPNAALPNEPPIAPPRNHRYGRQPQYGPPQFDPQLYNPPQYNPQPPQVNPPQYQQYNPMAFRLQPPQYQAPQYPPSQYQAPQHQAPQYQPPQHQAPQYQPPQYPHQAPQYKAPQYQAPQYQAPLYPPQAPQYQAPQYPPQAPQYPPQAPQYQPQAPQNLHQPPQHNPQPGNFPQYKAQQYEHPGPYYPQEQSAQYNLPPIDSMNRRDNALARVLPPGPPGPEVPRPNETQLRGAPLLSLGRGLPLSVVPGPPQLPFTNQPVRSAAPASDPSV